MQEILDAILAEQYDASAGSTSPTTTGGSRCTRTRRTCSRASRPREKDPRKSLHVDDVADPRARARARRSSR